ncbi:MAG: hypothetical protein ABIP06_10875 [Pyrinomonadaceae bacterium]
MKFNSLHLKQFSIVTISFLCLIVFSSGSAFGQKKPKTLKLDVDIDDRQLCSRSPVNGVERIANSQFCDYHTQYNDPKLTEAQKKAYRNEMIELVRGQVDTYYKLRKDGRKTDIRWLQMIFDVLEVGSSTAISIMNGERAKTVVGAALSGFQGGRTAFNRNFDILQTQALINKMTANRIEILLEIEAAKDQSTQDYSWYEAKNDLRRYLLAGTYSNGLDSLVKETGEEAARAERTLREVKNRPILDEVTEQNFTRMKSVNVILETLRKDSVSEDETKQEAARKILRDIFIELDETAELKYFFKTKTITKDSKAKDLYDALVGLQRKFFTDDELLARIGDVIVKIGN